MANVYKLQRYVNGNWVDVQLGQMNNVPVTQADEPGTETNESENTIGTILEQYLTLSQIQNEFLPTSVLNGNPTLQTVTQGLGTAIGANSVAFGNSATVGRGAVAFGSYIASSLSSLSVPGYWHVETNAEGIFYMKIDELDDKVSSTISELEKLIIRAVVENTTYYLVITQVTPYNGDSYKFSFSTTTGDWAVFCRIIDSWLADSTSELLDVQFTFIEDVARGSNSFMTGQFNVTLEENSNALGKGLKATVPNQTVVGQYNANSNALFVVGGGQSHKRKNIFEVSPESIIFNGLSEEFYLPAYNTHLADWKELTKKLSDRWKQAKQVYVLLEHNYTIAGGPGTGTYTNRKQVFITKPLSASSGFDLEVINWSIVNNHMYNYIKTETDTTETGSKYYDHFLNDVTVSTDFDELRIVFDYTDNCAYAMCYQRSTHRWVVGVPTGSIKVKVYYLN